MSNNNGSIALYMVNKEQSNKHDCYPVAMLFSMTYTVHVPDDYVVSH